MAELNSIVDQANKQYMIKAIRPSCLDCSSLSTRHKFAEIIRLAQTHILAPSTQSKAVNQGIRERSKKQEAIHNKWNIQARQINAKNRDVNALLDEIHRLYNTTKDGIKIAKAENVKPVN
jgi:hypothetical protein